MDAVEFLKAYRRVCGISACTKCPLWVEEHYACMMDAKIIDKVQPDESEIIFKVEQWAKEHPVKTRQSEFLKMFPNIGIDVRDGIILLSPYALDIKIQEGVECQDNNCAECRKNYWLQEIQEEE